MYVYNMVRAQKHRVVARTKVKYILAKVDISKSIYKQLRLNPRQTKVV